MIYFAVYTARIVAEVYWRRVILKSDMQSVMAARRRWAQRVLYGVGVRVETSGAPPDFPCLVLSDTTAPTLIRFYCCAICTLIR